MRTSSSFKPKFFTLGWEGNFNVKASIEWMNNVWYAQYLFIILFYMPLIFLGPKIMEKRQPIKPKVALFLWNALLAAFSILSFVHMLPELVYSLQTFGLHHSMCRSSFNKYSSVAYWHYLFALGKIPELVDTLFLVLRKQNLIFLHTFHHSIVIPFVWLNHSHQNAGLRWFNIINAAIHAIMYTYFALKCYPNLIRIPKQVSMLITSSQTIQMLVGIAVSGYAFHQKLSGKSCDTSWSSSIYGIALYSALLILFSKFFYDSYLSPKPLKDRSSEEQKKSA